MPDVRLVRPGALGELSGRNPPRWILAVVSGPEQADYIAGRISKTSLPPKPTLIHGKLGELESCRKKALHPGIQVGALEVHNDSCATCRALYRVQRERGVALRAFKARVAWWGMDDKRKAHIAIERDGSLEVGDRPGNLIEVHGSLCMRSDA